MIGGETADPPAPATRPAVVSTAGRDILTRRAVMRALDRYKVRPVAVKGETLFAVFSGRKQATNASSYVRAIRAQRDLTVDAIMRAAQ